MAKTFDLNRAAIIGLGANLENPLEMIREAVKRLNELPGMRLAAMSSIYLTEPQGGPEEQNWYHNAVAFFETSLAPVRLLRSLMITEKAMGRKRLVRWGPRVIDMDFLAKGDLVVEAPPELFLPHPRMHERLFVMAPLAEVAPGWRHPILNQTAAELLARIPSEGQGLKKLEEEVSIPC
ncbi:2-amino-4-hydroxy-6-hydroxymethyldihydropteridine diphosphokinase [Deltaproteobacteria bacterium Smac51]|nr:2-amino-4-hydroxy-6-hydroxymethyldihydropteridine diphosphokinase [Deltaproteobacteria bacterium Smac51]